MRDRAPPLLLLLLLTASCAFLASLYLPWRSSNAGGVLEGWTEIESDAAALFALALAAASAAALLQPPLVAKLPFGGLGIGLAYFTAGAAVQMDSAFGTPPNPGVSTSNGSAAIHYGWTYGVYLGAGSAAVAGVAALVLRRPELFRRRMALDAPAGLLGLGLLASYLLPWFMTSAHGPTAIGLDTGPATIAAAGILLCAGRLLYSRAPLQLGGAVATAVLTGSAATGLPLSITVDRYGKWTGIGCAVALVALEAVRVRPFRLPAAPPQPAARTGAAVVLLAALFLPAEVYHLPGVEITASGWQTTYGYGAAAGALALLLLFALMLPRLESYTVDATLAVALLVATFGIFWAELPVPRLGFGYGAYIDFSAAALLLLLVLPRLRPIHVERRRAAVWAMPLAASTACLVAILLPMWSVLPQLWSLPATAVQSWSSIAALLMAIHLFHAWVLRMRGSVTEPHRLTLVPLALLVLPTLQLVRLRDVAIVWGGVILAALCLLLALLGWVEESGGGLERFRVPELLRVDRLPGTGG